MRIRFQSPIHRDDRKPGRIPLRRALARRRNAAHCHYVAPTGGA